MKRDVKEKEREKTKGRVERSTTEQATLQPPERKSQTTKVSSARKIERSGGERGCSPSRNERHRSSNESNEERDISESTIDPPRRPSDPPDLRDTGDDAGDSLRSNKTKRSVRRGGKNKGKEGEKTHKNPTRDGSVSEGEFVPVVPVLEVVGSVGTDGHGVSEEEVLPDDGREVESGPVADDVEEV